MKIVEDITLLVNFIILFRPVWLFVFMCSVIIYIMIDYTINDKIDYDDEA